MPRHPLGTLALALSVSLALHGGGVVLIGLRAGWFRGEEEKKHLVELQVTEAPTPPPPPEPPPPEPPAPPKPKPKPRPKPAPKPADKPPALATTSEHRPEAAPELPGDAGPGDAGPPPADAALPDAPPAPDAGPVPPDGGPLVASGPQDAGPVAQIDPGVLDLRPFVPGGEKLMLALRTDRLRGTPWSKPLDDILRPMPDYQLLFAPTGLGVADAFETLVIASSDPTQVPQTFLAARVLGDESALRRTLGGARSERVAWSRAAGGTVGRRLDPRVQRMQDPRLLLVPAPSWFLLVRPELVPGMTDATGAPAPPRPPWLELLPRVEDQTGDAALAVLVVADVGTGSLALPTLPPLPIPQRLTLAITPDPKGLVITGAAVFADAPTARAFRDAIDKARTEALGSLARRLLLRGLAAEGLVRRLQTRLKGEFVTYSTSVTSEEGTLLLARAAELSRHYFLRPRPAPAPAPPGPPPPP